MIPRGPFQPLTFCGSVIHLGEGVNDEVTKFTAQANYLE